MTPEGAGGYRPVTGLLGQDKGTGLVSIIAVGGPGQCDVTATVVVTVRIEQYI